VSRIRGLEKHGGYTLLETLVAMALFLSVLIPIGVAVGNLLLDDSVNKMNTALQAAQTEFSRIIAEDDFSDGTPKNELGLIIVRRFERNNELVDVQVTVATVKHPERPLITLHRSLVVYQ
jgi:hypothetical protein